MNNHIHLIVMLTHNDQTVLNAEEIFKLCQNSKADYWGLKEQPLPLDQMKRLFHDMKKCNKITVLESVTYTEEEGLQSAQTAHLCGCDILMGTKYFDSIHSYCTSHNIKYMPFIGNVHSRPSILSGDIEEILAEAKNCMERGVYGLDLLAYRYDGDISTLLERTISEVPAPICIAGSIDSYERLDTLRQLQPWGFTIGGAFFDQKFGSSICEQIHSVTDYMHSKGGTYV